MTVEKGFDPRDFVLFAFGGAGPVHAGVFARELGVQKVIVPQRKTASTWCAFGAAAADVLHIYEQVEIMRHAVRCRRASTGCSRSSRTQAPRRRWRRTASRRRASSFEFSLDMRHRGQINEVEVMLPESTTEGRLRRAAAAALLRPLRAALRARLVLPRARLEIVTLRLRATAPTPRPKLTKARTLTAAIPKAAQARHPPDLLGGAEAHAQDADLRRRSGCGPGNRIKGPASSRRRRPPSSCRRGGRCASMPSATSRSCSSEAAMPKLSEMKGVTFDGVPNGYVPPKKLVDLAEAQAPHAKAKKEHRPGHLRGRAPRAVERERGARRDHPAPLRLAGGDVRARPQPVDPHRGRRVRLLRAVHAVHVRRHRHAGEVDAREPQRQPGHPRRRHVPRQRPVGRRRAPDGRDAASARCSGRASCSAGSPTACTSTTSAASRPARFCPLGARTPSTRASCIPPVKIVENNEIRRDIEEVVSAQPRASPTRWRSTSARSSPATSPRATGSLRSSSATARRPSRA